MIIDEHRLFTTGGVKSNSRAAYIIDTRDGTGWTQVGELSGKVRNFLSCGLVRDDEGRPVRVVAAGTTNGEDTGYEVDIYDLLSGVWTPTGVKIIFIKMPKRAHYVHTCRECSTCASGRCFQPPLWQ